MNQPNFQHMQGQAMPPQPAPQLLASSNNAAHVHQYILQNLQQQPALPGWQSTVQIQTRGNIIFQIFSQLRLLKSQLDVQYQLQLALSFEAKAFTDAPERAAYDQMCKKKLTDIYEMRTKQSAGLQQQMNLQMSVPQQMQNMAQNMAQTPSQGLGPGHFPPSLQHQQMMQLHGMPMQPQSQPPQNMSMRQPQPNMPQAAAPQQMVQHPHQFAPTAEDNQIITQMANRMYSQTPQPRMEAIQNNLNNMDPKTRENLARQGVDPLAWFFRTQAMKRYMDVKRAQAGSAQPAGVINGGPRPMSGGPPAQSIPTPQQNFEPPFDQIFGQQQDGLRSQEAGQIVVPASNPQASLDQRNAARANAQQQMNIQNGANRGLQNVPVNQPQPQAFWNAQTGQRTMNQGAGITANAAPNISAAGQNPANVLQGQPGGLDNQITRTPSQQTGMPTLNKAAPPGQAPNMWTQRPPQMNQPKPQGNAMPSQASQQTMERADAPPQRPSLFQNLPPHVQQRLRSMPEDQRRTFLVNIQQRHMSEQQSRQHQQQLQHNLQQQQMAHARAGMNDSFPMSSQPSQPGMQTGPTGPMSNQTMSGQRPPPQNSNAQQPPFAQPNAAMGGPAQQQAGTGQRPPQQRGPSQYQAPLTDEQARQMDQKTFPVNMLSHPNQLAPRPKEVKTWGQLKEWAAQNAQTLPHATLEKLKNLQAIHYRAQFEGSRPPQAGAAPASNPQPQAPFAQMVSQPNSQPPVPAPQLTNRISVPKPSFQEIQAFRTGLAPQYKNVTDAQVHAFLIRQRQQEVAKKMQAQQAQNVQTAAEAPKAAQAQNQGQGSAGQNDPSQGTQKGPAKGTVQQNAKAVAPATNQGKPGQANRGTPATKQQQKGTKRSSQDDVVEISNPNLGNTQAGAQAQYAVQASKQQPPVGSNEQKTQGDTKGSANLKGVSQPQTGEAPGSRPAGILRNLPQQDIDRRDTRLRQLMTEVGQSQQPRRPVQMSAQVKNEMSQKLRELAPMVSRMEISLPTFFRYNPDEDVAKQLIRTRQIIKAQYRDDKYNLVEHFTIGQAELEAAYTKVKQYFVYVMEKFGSKSKAAPPPGEPAQNQPQPQQATASQEKAPLNAANLDEHQNMLKAQRAAAIQKHHSGYGSRAPAAPTSEKAPPFPLPLGPQSPHGIPYYGPTTLTADQLVLPSKRRRSNNYQPSAGSTPVPAHDTPVAKSSPAGPKHTSPEIRKAPLPQLSFKCGVSDCQAGQKGFMTQSELEQHNVEVHEPQEPIIDDPMEFALESMRLALGLDENGKSKPQAPKMKLSLSAQSHGSTKQETSTPMARAATQTGPSPASNLLKTPQASTGIKTPASDASKGKNVKGSATSPKDTTSPPVDPWAGSCISAEDIVSSWSSLAEMNSMSFTTLQKGLTPSSTDFSSNEKSERNSPRTSDISENDAVKISIDVKNDNDDWIPSEWFENSLYSDIESMNFGPDSFMEDAGWDIFAGIEDTQMVDIGPSTGKAKRKDDQNLVSEEWLKVYAPEKLPAKKGK